MTKKRDKLTSVNVPKMFYDRFLADVPAGTCSVIDKLHNTPEQSRGRGLSRVLRNITEQEWNDLYQYAAAGRAAMKGADRETTLTAAICAKTVADRMEAQGVDNPVGYVPKPTTRRTKAQIEADRAQAQAEEEATRRAEESQTELDFWPPEVPSEPPTIATVNVPEATPSEQEAFQKDMALGK